MSEAMSDEMSEATSESNVDIAETIIMNDEKEPFLDTQKKYLREKGGIGVNLSA